MDHHGDRIKTAWSVVGTSLVVQVGQDVGYDTMQAVLASGSPLRGSSAFMTIYNRLAKGASVWGVVNGRSKLFDQLSASGLRPVAMEGALRLSDRVVLAGTATFDTPEVATQVDAMLKGFIPQAKQLFERVDSQAEGATVHVELGMNAAQLPVLLNTL
jgi:hypothetical protein